ncbi:hypothetical protein J437_LFUL008576 [Ladona fulva]|uniref:Uncharacterized protein n=1 Tax=Ladona fulva TaxID=123851 RepID=A0A8K0K734_LADFU|nr:hypothetical protein J437_LFUL008576 [Ladona fulva]
MYHRSLIDSIYDAGIDLLKDMEYDGKARKNVEKVPADDKYELPEKHPFSYDSLKDELKRHGPWALMIAEMMLRIVMVDSSKAADAMEATILNGTEEQEEDKMIGYDMLQQLNTKEYYNRMFQVFRELVQKGYLSI